VARDALILEINKLLLLHLVGFLYYFTYMAVNVKHVVCNKNISHIVKFNTEKCFLSFVDRFGKMVYLMCSQLTVGSVNTST